MLSANAVPIAARLKLQAKTDASRLNAQLAAGFLAYALHQSRREKKAG
jgi:hypothetical protein